jgi:hypothetical protein
VQLHDDTRGLDLNLTYVILLLGTVIVCLAFAQFEYNYTVRHAVLGFTSSASGHQLRGGLPDGRAGLGADDALHPSRSQGPQPAFPPTARQTRRPGELAEEQTVRRFLCRRRPATESQICCAPVDKPHGERVVLPPHRPSW